MKATQCDNCKILQTYEEDVRPSRNNNRWMHITRRAELIDLDFCRESCAINYFSKWSENTKEKI